MSRWFAPMTLSPSYVASTPDPTHHRMRLHFLGRRFRGLATEYRGVIDDGCVELGDAAAELRALVAKIEAITDRVLAY